MGEGRGGGVKDVAAQAAAAPSPSRKAVSVTGQRMHNFGFRHVFPGGGMAAAWRSGRGRHRHLPARQCRSLGEDRPSDAPLGQADDGKMIVVAEIHGRELVPIGLIGAAPHQHVLTEAVKLPSVKEVAAAGISYPGNAGVHGARVHNGHLSLLNPIANNLEVFQPPRLELLVNKKLPRAGLQEGLPRLVRADK